MYVKKFRDMSLQKIQIQISLGKLQIFISLFADFYNTTSLQTWFCYLMFQFDLKIQSKFEY